MALALIGFALSGCSLWNTNLSGGTTSNETWNSVLKADNDHFKCPYYQGVSKDKVDYKESYPWEQVNLTKTVDIYFYGEANRQKTNESVFRYFKYATEVPVPAYKVDEGIETHLDNLFRGFPLEVNSIADTMLVPLANANTATGASLRQPLSEIINPDSRWGARSESEIYTMNQSRYFGFNLQKFNPEGAISTDNYPAVIYILYKPDRYALYPPDERAKRSEYKTSKPLYFDVYYSVAKYNEFFKDNCSEPNTRGLTPPWEFGVCRYTKNSTKPANASSGAVATAPSAGNISSGNTANQLEVPRLHRQYTPRCLSSESHIAPPADTEGDSPNERRYSDDIALDTLFSWYLAPKVFSSTIADPAITQKDINDRAKLALMYEAIWPLNGVTGLISSLGGGNVNFTAPGFDVDAFTKQLNITLRQDSGDNIELYSVKSIARNLDKTDPCDCFGQYPLPSQATERLRCAFNHSRYKVDFGEAKRAANREIITPSDTFGERDMGGSNGNRRSLAGLLGELKTEMNKIGADGLISGANIDRYISPNIASKPANTAPSAPITPKYEGAHPFVDYKIGILDWPWCWFMPE